MSRRLPPFVSGRIYHLYNRGAHRLSIFHEEDNYLFVLQRLKRYCRELLLTPIAYCLLPNHYLLLIRQDGEHAAGLLPRRIFNSYVKAYNKRYDHRGTLFEGPYRAVEVNNDAYLLHLCRYIHANPVAHGLVESVEEWPYSNYPEWVGLRQGTLVAPALVARFFAKPADYQAYLVDYLRDRQLPEVLEYVREW